MDLAVAIFLQSLLLTTVDRPELPQAGSRHQSVHSPLRDHSSRACAPAGELGAIQAAAIAISSLFPQGAASSTIHIYLRSTTLSHSCCLRGKELVGARSSIRLVVTGALSFKECECAASVIKGLREC